MAVKILALLKRRPDLSLAEFRKYYDESHRRLFETVTPPDIRGGITRYVQNHAAPRTDPGSASPWDCITEMEFDDRDALRKWGRWYASADGRVLRDDEEKFIDTSQRVIILADPR
jgi:EthD domain